MSTKPKILFIPGAWHSEFHAQPVLPYFNSLGYNVKVLVLASLGAHEDEDPKPGTRESVEAVLEVMQDEAKAGRNFILLAHSAGGLVGAIATNRFLESATGEEKSRLKHIIFLASFIRTSKHIISHWHHMDLDKGLSWVLNPEEVFYNDMTIEESKPYCDALQPMILSSRPDEIELLWYQIPRTFILALQDKSLLPHKQRGEAEEHGFAVVEIDSGHCPFISQPENFANIVDSIIAEKAEDR